MNVDGKHKRAELPDSHNDASPCILLVDDDASFRIAAKNVLSKRDFNVEEATNGVEALEKLGKKSFDAILLDAKMPLMDGFITCSKIGEMMGEQCPPIVLSTGLDDEDSIERAFSVGASDYVTKPVNWSLLTGKLQHLIKKSALDQAATLQEQISRVISAHSGIYLILDHEAVILSGHQIESLPSHDSHPLAIGACLFDCIPKDCIAGALESWKRLLESGETNPAIISNHSDVAPFIHELSFALLSDHRVICMIQDFTGNYLTEQRFYNLAYLDKVTGVGNRARFVDWLNETANREIATETTAVIRCRLNNFASYEGRLGRAGLDDAAVQIASRLKALCQSHSMSLIFGFNANCMVGRLTDNEFAIGLIGSPTSEQLTRFADAVRQELNGQIWVNAIAVCLESVIGLANKLSSGADAIALLSAASIAMRLPDKAGVDDRVYHYNDDVEEYVKKQAEMERYFFRDLDTPSIQVFFQPKVDARSMALVGVEALLRWECEELGKVSPEDFIPLAEQCGLMARLTDRVISLVLKQICAWKGTAFADTPVAINVSGSCLSSPDFAEMLNNALAKNEISPHLIELEVTETMMIDARSCAIDNLTKLRRQGVNVSVDDFGTGYSSFSYLQKLPVDVLKIDKSFVQNINSDPKALAIAKAIITVGRELAMKVVAEGVECVEQLQLLRELGCHTIQGYFTGRPVMAEDLVSASELAGRAAS